MAKSKKWTKKDYATQAAEFVACYGVGYCWDEFVYEYMQLFEPGEPKPDPDKLMDAILVAQSNMERMS